MARTKKTTDTKLRKRQIEFLFGKETANHPFYQTVYATHHEIVQYCDYCGKPMTRSEVNDYGSLCESCYMREYYGK